MRILKRILLAALTIVLLSSCESEKKLSETITDWKYFVGDNTAWSASDYNDSAWEHLDNSSVYVGDTHYAWLRVTVPVPPSLHGKKLWLGMSRFNAAADVYADGAYIGSRGRLPPDEMVRVEGNISINIPTSAIHDGEVTLAVRMYGPTDCITEINFFLQNDAKAYFENVIHNQFGQRFFLMLTVVCVFIMLYSFAGYLGNTKDLAYLNFSLSMLFISIYLFDIGSEIIFLPYNLNRSLCRACLPISMMFMGLFLNRFFNRKHYKTLLILSLIFDAIDVIAYLCCIGNQAAMDMLFNIMLLPIVVIIVYGFVTSTQAFKQRGAYALNMFLGFTIGAVLALHDVIYSIIGKVPFMWTQAISFFAVDLAIFITLSVRSAKSQKQVVALAQRTEEQHKRLVEIMGSAQKLASETADISDELADSVEAVTQAARTSRDKVLVINNAIHEQSSVHTQTADTVTQLAHSLKDMNNEFDTTTDSIQSTASGTRTVMEGIANVSEGIYSAENFTRSLNSITATGSADMKKLLEVIESIQKSSAEILSVVNALDDFAQQTDLLSMNASIEAAHSGESGKGFAVIAHEIKDLAAQSSSRSTKIAEIITSVIKSIKESVKLTERVNQTFLMIQTGAEQSVDKVTDAANSIKQQLETGAAISHEAEIMANSADRMRESVSTQRIYSSQVLANMERLTVASQKVDDASSDIEDGAKALAEEVESLNTLAERTRKTAQALKKLMVTE